MVKQYGFILLLILWSSGLAAKNSPKPLIKLVGIDIPYVRNHMSKIISNAYGRLGYQVSIDYHNTARSQRLSDSGYYDGDVGRVESFSQHFEHLVKVDEPLGRIRVHLICNNTVLDCNKSALDSPKNSLVAMHGMQIFERILKNSAINIVRISQINKLTDMLKKNRVQFGFAIKHVESDKFLFNVSGLKVSRHHLHEEKVFHFIHQRHSSLKEPLAKAIKREINTVGW